MEFLYLKNVNALPHKINLKLTYRQPILLLTENNAILTFRPGI